MAAARPSSISRAISSMRSDPNPFRRKRRANQATRYLNPRQAKEHPSYFDRAGNPTFTLPDRINKQD